MAGAKWYAVLPPPAPPQQPPQPGLLGELRNALVMHQAQLDHMQDALINGTQPMTLEQFAEAQNKSIKPILPRERADAMALLSPV